MEALLPSSLPQKRPIEDEHEPDLPVAQPIGRDPATPQPDSMQQPLSSPLSSPPNYPADGNIPSSTTTIATMSNTPTQPAKRRKLTQQEKEDQRLEKEAKAKAREEKKAQKAAEDKIKAEQKAQKDEEKRKKMEERDEKKRLKEEEQHQKEEEKAKKERSQMRLNAFFAKPKATESRPGQDVVDLTQTPQAPSISLAPDAPANDTNSGSPSPQKSLVRKAISDYGRYFLPFNLAPHVIMAPINAFMEDADQLSGAQARLDSVINNASTESQAADLSSFKSAFGVSNDRGHETPSISHILEAMNGSAAHAPNPDSPTYAQSEGGPLSLLKCIPMKYLHFNEDVRPPYYGTYTAPYTRDQARRLARNPFSRTRQDTNYDYDSEAEWEEPEEGEDLNSDGEDDLDDDAEDDMDGFLDDEEDAQVKRRLISGDLVPLSTGLCWEDTENIARLNDGSGAICTELRDFKMGILLDSQPQSIDPFSTSYWTPEPIPVLDATKTVSKNGIKSGVMNPPRAPLAQRTMNGLLNTLNTPQPGSSSTTSKPAKAKRMIPPEHMTAFKAEIDGKDLTKIGMIESLKKAFPKIPKDAISNTLSVVAARVGPTEKEKRWVLINP